MKTNTYNETMDKVNSIKLVLPPRKNTNIAGRPLTGYERKAKLIG